MRPTLTAIAAVLALFATSAHAVVDPAPATTTTLTTFSQVVTGTFQGISLVDFYLPAGATFEAHVFNAGLPQRDLVRSMFVSLVDMNQGSWSFMTNFWDLGTYTLKEASFKGEGFQEGKYQISLYGETTTTAGVVGTLSITTPVPEPETWVMMLGGLSAFGFMAHRQRKRV